MSGEREETFGGGALEGSVDFLCFGVGAGFLG